MTIGWVRKGDWIQTASGRQFWPLDPHPDEVCIEDIAYALSMICRFGGHCSRFYSVAEHSVHVVHNVSPENRLWGLLHDASEAYIGDMVRPLKRNLPDYQAAENRMMYAVQVHFSLPGLGIPDEVKRVDNAMLATEAGQLMRRPPNTWTLPEPPIDGLDLPCWSPVEAHRNFMLAYYDIIRRT